MAAGSYDPLPPEFSGLDAKWQTLIGAGWHGEDHLGSGTFGETSVWVYRTPPNQTPPHTTRIVLKIISNNDSDFADSNDACRESFTQELLTQAKSIHVVRHYGGFKVVGQELGFFMELCEGGVLGRLLRHDGEVSGGGDEWFLELDLWGFFD